VPDDLDLAVVDRVNVQLEVEDERGAVGTDLFSVVIQNRAPVWDEIQVNGANDPGPGGGKVLGLPLEVIAIVRDEDVGDPLLLDWEFPRAPSGAGSDPDAVVWEQRSDTEVRFVPDVPGLWEIRVTARDDAGGESMFPTQILVAPDRPPCIALTDPTALAGARYVIERSEGARRFAVRSVVDALDRFPLAASDGPPHAETTFAWRIATPDTGGELVAMSGHVAADYLFDPQGLSPGDVASLQVEVRDRVQRVMCPTAEATCSIDGNGCFQRLTWEMEIR
jgi:hypothetical protein